MAHGKQCMAQGAVCFGMRLYTETGLKVPGEVSAYKFRSIVRCCVHTHIILSGLKKWTAESPWSMVVFHLPLVWWLVKAKEQGTHGWLLKFNTTFSHELTTVSKVGSSSWPLGRKNAMEAILSYLLKVSRVSVCIVMEIEFLFSQKPANLTAKSLKNGGKEGFRGFFPL